MTLHDLKVGKDTLDPRFWRDGDRSRWEILAHQGGVQVQEQPWVAESPGR